MSMPIVLPMSMLRAVRGQRRRLPHYGKHRTRTTAARDFARPLRKNSISCGAFGDHTLRGEAIAGYLPRRALPLPRGSRGGEGGRTSRAFRGRERLAFEFRGERL